MARKTHDDALGVAGAETVIGTGVIVHGNLNSESDIIIDGTLDGSIKTRGNVTIGINAQIKGNVQASNATIAGSVRGNITTDGETTILETGHVEGDITGSGLAIASGGVFIGRSIMEAPPRLEREAAPAEPAETTAATPAPATEPEPKRKKTGRDHEV